MVKSAVQVCVRTRPTSNFASDNLKIDGEASAVAEINRWLMLMYACLFLHELLMENGCNVSSVTPTSHVSLTLVYRHLLAGRHGSHAERREADDQ